MRGLLLTLALLPSISGAHAGPRPPSLTGVWIEVDERTLPGPVLIRGAFANVRGYEFTKKGAGYAVRAVQEAWGAAPVAWGLSASARWEHGRLIARGGEVGGATQTWTLTFDRTRQQLIGECGGRPCRFARMRRIKPATKPGDPTPP